MLRVNYDSSKRPFHRTEIYKDSPELLKGEDEVIGVLSTVQLYKIAIAVKRGEMKREDARNRIKRTGRVASESR